MPIPPFPPTKPVDPPAEPVRRATKESTKGSALDKPVVPAAELRIHYEMQFRFVNFWRIITATPYWDGATAAKDLPTILAGAPVGWLEADDRIVQHEESDEAKATVEKKSLTMIRVSSQQLSTDSDEYIWVPRKGVLPAHLDATRRKAWKAPTDLKNGPNRHQWGIRGTMELYLDPFDKNKHEASYKSVCVWERWKPGDSKYTAGMCVLPPGVYAGYPRAMGNHNTPEEKIEEYPAIQVGAEWIEEEPPEDAAADAAPSGAWADGARGWRVKNSANLKATSSIFIHPGNQPVWFLGCQSPGPEDKQTEWGFEKRDDTRTTMWEILEKVGISKADFVSRASDPGKKHRKWFLIRVTAEDDAIAADGWKRFSIWL